MKKSFWLGLVIMAVVVGAGRLAWRAHHDLVSLDVREMPLREVVTRLRWQTWEPIYVGAGVEGRVTLRVEDQPLEVVLNILNDQINGHWTAVYPLYSSRKSLNVARALARGEVSHPVVGWTNWTARPMTPLELEVRSAAPETDGPTRGRVGSGGPGGLSEDWVSSTVVRISLKLTNAMPTLAAVAVGRQAGARVVPEDGTKLPVTLDFENQPLESAVATLAKKVLRKWTRFYVFESRRPSSPAPGRSLESTSETAIARERPPQPSAEEITKLREQMAADPARQEQAVNRLLTSLKNSTPQQRTERDVVHLARQRAQAAR